jgi:hypothetical protein
MSCELWPPFRSPSPWHRRRFNICHQYFMSALQRDVALWTSSKLADSWSASAIEKDLTDELLHGMVNDWPRLDPMTKVRLIIACSLLEQSRQDVLADSLRALMQRAAQDDNEWVRLYGTSLLGMQHEVDLRRAATVMPEVCLARACSIGCTLLTRTSHSTCQLDTTMCLPMRHDLTCCWPRGVVLVLLFEHTLSLRDEQAVVCATCYACISKLSAFRMTSVSM